ncbi:hypothetical protein [Frigoriflavimonas asaccharolytica]|uniref:Uncharacterized protein n=1 Tax=Frigoriflavimonas asaccharolytica TaxID=2735899 RepID=A0A8J8GB62_9FLAO|nr:hypothetical protein [Frigoriflavimonas asaccharolytica]NRS92740.1 hypothetical protein [Frigoriflavimonas asaccharolytica]
MAILIHTNSFEEQTFLENLLKKMQVSFERKDIEQKVSVSIEEMESIRTGLEQANKGELKDSESVHQKAKLLCSR